MGHAFLSVGHRTDHFVSRAHGGYLAFLGEEIGFVMHI